MKIAAIGDPHGCIDELQLLVSRLSWLSLDDIYVLGDFVDRGPDSGAVVQFARENHIKGILGNHEESILKLHKRSLTGGELPQSEDKKRTLLQLTLEDIAWLEKLPMLEHIQNESFDAVLVHGGLWPTIPIHNQPKNVIRCQMIKSAGKVGDVRWWGPDAAFHKSGRTEEQNREDGYVRWYEVYDHPHDVYFGHSVFTQPFIGHRQGYGRTVGVDTGSCFGGALTAAIIDGGEPWFVSVKAKKPYVDKGFRVHQE